MSIELLVRDYLRSKSSLMALLNNDPRRLNMDFTGDARATHVTIYRAGGSLHGYMPLDVPAISLHCFGNTRPVAADIADTVAWEMRNITSVAAPLLVGDVESVTWLPASDGTPRYVVTTTVTARLAQAA